MNDTSVVPRRPVTRPGDPGVHADRVQRRPDPRGRRVRVLGPPASRRRGHPGDRAAAGEHDRGAVRADQVRRTLQGADHALGEGGERLGVVRRRADPAVQRSVAASNQAWNSALVGSRSPNGTGCAASIADVVELVPALVARGLDAVPAGRARTGGLGGLAVPAHAAVHDQVRHGLAGAERVAEQPGLLPAERREHVVVVGAPRRLAVADQQQLAHQCRSRRRGSAARGTSRPGRRSRTPGCVVWPWK